MYSVGEVYACMIYILFFVCFIVLGLVGSCIGLFILAMLYEGLKVFREYLLEKAICKQQQRAESHAQNSDANNGPLNGEAGEDPTPDSTRSLTVDFRSEFRLVFFHFW